MAIALVPALVASHVQAQDKPPTQLSPSAVDVIRQHLGNGEWRGSLKPDDKGGLIFEPSTPVGKVELPVSERLIKELRVDPKGLPAGGVDVLLQGDLSPDGIDARSVRNVWKWNPRAWNLTVPTIGMSFPPALLGDVQQDADQLFKETAKLVKNYVSAETDYFAQISITNASISVPTADVSRDIIAKTPASTADRRRANELYRSIAQLCEIEVAGKGQQAFSGADWQRLLVAQALRQAKSGTRVASLGVFFSPALGSKACYQGCDRDEALYVEKLVKSLPAFGKITVGSNTCSGTLVSPTLLLTAAHCLRQSRDSDVTFQPTQMRVTLCGGTGGACEQVVAPVASVAFPANLQALRSVVGSGQYTVDVPDIMVLRLADSPALRKLSPVKICPYAQDYEPRGGRLMAVGYGNGPSASIMRGQIFLPRKVTATERKAIICEQFPEIDRRVNRFEIEQSSQTGVRLTKEKLAEIRSNFARELRDAYVQSSKAPGPGEEQEYFLAHPRYGKQMPAFAHDADGQPGDSGAALLLNPDFCVRGVYSGGVLDNSNRDRPTFGEHEIAVDVKDMLELMRKAGATELLKELGAE